MTAYAHMATAFAYMVIGAVLLNLAAQMWFRHPVNRVFLFGPYLTEEGLRLVLKSWPMVFLFGAFILSCAIDHALDLMAGGHRAHSPGLEIAAVTEAVISLFTAGCVLRIWATRRSWEKN
jgi:hypothetical protein